MFNWQGVKKSSLQLSSWHYLCYRDVNMTSPVTLHQLIKDNPFYAQKRIMEKKTGWGVTRIWFFPLDEQIGTSLSMSSEDPTAIPSAGVHVVQLESTDCWEFAAFLRSSSYLALLPGDSTCERCKRIDRKPHTTISEQVKKIAAENRLAEQIQWVYPTHWQSQVCQKPAPVND